MTLTEIRALITANETQQGASDRITATEVRAVDNAIVDYIEANPGGGIGPASYVVAASDSTSDLQDRADFLCDGTNDEEQINAALAAGKSVELSEGTFNIGAAIVLSVANQVLKGQGNNTQLILASEANVNVIEITAAAKVKDLYIDGGMANQSTTAHGVLVNADNASVENCTIKNTRNDNISVNSNCDDVVIRNNILDTTKALGSGSNILCDGKRVLIENNSCTGADNTGIFTDDNSNNAVIRNNKITNSGVDFLRANGLSSVLEDNIITVQDSFVGDYPIAIGDNTVVKGNTIYVGALTDSIGAGNGVIQTYGKNNTIINNSIYFTDLTVGHWGICTENPSDGGKNTIIGNLIVNLAGTPVDTDSRGIQLAGPNNVCTGNNIIGFYYGIRDYQSEGFHISNISSNVFNGVNYPIFFEGETLSLNISNNIIKSCITAISSVTNSLVQYLTIIGNVISECTNEAMILRGVEYSTISNNTITNSGTGTNDIYAAILLNTVTGTNYAKYNTISGNTITSTAVNKHKYGVRENSSNDGPNIVANNIALNAVTGQISVQHASSITPNNITT